MSELLKVVNQTNYMLPLKEKAAAIRAELKTYGINSKQVSVKGRFCGYSDSIDITVKDLTANINLIESIANDWEHIDRDERTYEILSGGNTYINFSIDYQATRAEAPKYFETARKWIADNENGAREIGSDVYTSDTHRIIFWQHHPVQPWYPMAFLMKSKIVMDRNGEEFTTWEKIDTCKVTGVDALAESLVIWNHRHQVEIAI